jgi:prevent-host-death family protein
MASTVGSYEAKTHLPALLKRVAKGERITITNNGEPIARLVPVEPAEKPDVKQVIQEMRAFRARSGPLLGDDVTIRDLIEEGRRY